MTTRTSGRRPGPRHWHGELGEVLAEVCRTGIGPGTQSESSESKLQLELRGRVVPGPGPGSGARGPGWD